MQMKVKAAWTPKKTVKQVSRRVLLDSFINFYNDLRFMADTVVIQYGHIC